MSALDDIARWQKWATDNENYAGDVTVPDSPDVSFWFMDEHQAAATPCFHRFADGGDGSLICLWSEDGRFEDAPVVFLGHEGQVAWLAPDPKHAIALFAASGDSMEEFVAYKEVGETDEALAGFLQEAFGVSVPDSFETNAEETARLLAFMKKVTGQDYESY